MANKMKRKASGDQAEKPPVKNPPSKQQKRSGASDTLDPTKIFVGGIPKGLGEGVAKAHFAKCGDIVAFSFPMNQRGTKAMGVAFITYKSADSAEKCLKLHSTTLEGNKIAVRLQDDKPESAKLETQADVEGESKSQRKTKRKKERRSLMSDEKKAILAKRPQHKENSGTREASKADEAEAKQKKLKAKKKKQKAAKTDGADTKDESEVKSVKVKKKRKNTGTKTDGAATKDGAGVKSVQKKQKGAPP